MTERPDLTLVLHTADPAETQMLLSGAQQLCDVLSTVMLRPFTMALGQGTPAAPCVSILSLLGAVEDQRQGFAEIAALWHGQLSTLLAQAAGPVFLSTIFRHVPRGTAPSPERDARLERVRRLNLLAAELSQAHGVGVIDIDRFFTHIGGRLLRSDYRLGGVLARQIGGDVVAGALLAEGLDDVVAPEVLLQAQALRGGLTGLLRRVQRSLHAAEQGGAVHAGG